MRSSTNRSILSWMSAPERIAAVEWVSRHVPIVDGGSIGAWQNQPYKDVVVSRAEIERLWPVSLASDAPEQPRRPGRPQEYDWERVHQLAAEERRRGLTGRKLYEVVQTLYGAELKTRSRRASHPSETT